MYGSLYFAESCASTGSAQSDKTAYLQVELLTRSLHNAPLCIRLRPLCVLRRQREKGVGASHFDSRYIALPLPVVSPFSPLLFYLIYYFQAISRLSLL